MDFDPAHGLNAPTYVRLRERLREDIVSGVWPLGRHVTLSELSAHYRVSGNPIREALLHLEGDGIITMRMHRGAVIPDVDRRFVENIYDLNDAIAVMLIREVVKRLEPWHLQTIGENGDVFERVALTDDPVAMVRANRAFHRCINDIADNRPAAEIMRGRLSLIDALRVGLGYRPGRLDEIIQQHREILHALQRKDVDAAARAVSQHVRSARDDLLARITEKEGGKASSPKAVLSTSQSAEPASTGSAPPPKASVQRARLARKRSSRRVEQSSGL